MAINGISFGNTILGGSIQSLKAQMADGTTQTFAGCYQLHLSQPGVQGVPPFQPLGIRGASLPTVPNDSDPATLLGQGCP